jgi:hypothetical protein
VINKHWLLVIVGLGELMLVSAQEMHNYSFMEEVVKNFQPPLI